MAEAFARGIGGPRVEAGSAGSRPSGRVNPDAVRAMAERGYDLSGHRSTGVDEREGERFDVVVSMGCGDSCPRVPAGRRIEWDVEDPAGGSRETFAAVRDEIEERVRTLLRELAEQEED